MRSFSNRLIHLPIDHRSRLVIMENIKIKTLKGISIEEMCTSWSKAFSDYAVQMKMTPKILDHIFRQNSVHLNISVGAFDKGTLVGFWMNGYREINKIKLAYDSGTAIWPEYRNRGISKLLSEESNKLLIKKGVSEYILEVFKSNEKAINLYCKSGFKTSREFCCLMANKHNFKKTKIGRSSLIEIIPYNSSTISNLLPMEYEPSWQNNSSSLLNISDLIRFFVAREGKKIVGYGIALPSRGRICQIAFEDAYWNSKISSKLLKMMCESSETDEIMVINIDSRATRTLEFFKRHGFEPSLEQLEMKKNIAL